MRWRFTPDLPDRFFVDAANLATDLGCGSVFDLLGVEFYESRGCRADAMNPDTKAVGQIQLLPDNLPAVGWTRGPEEFAKLNAVDQLPYNARYLRRYRPLPTVAHVYCAVFMPADVQAAGDPEHVLSAKDGFRGWAFDLNANLDADGDLKIQVRELVQAVRRGCVGRRWAEIVTRTGVPAPAWLTPDPTDLSAPYGLQTALSDAGFDPGPRDGEMGPRTVAALVAFQRAHGLEPDGRPGPLTRRALRVALAGPPSPAA